jgi:hypothetical protein
MMKKLRVERDRLLNDSDFMIANSEESIWLLEKYKQELRDFPELVYQEQLATGHNLALIWPTKPSLSDSLFQKNI